MLAFSVFDLRLIAKIFRVLAFSAFNLHLLTFGLRLLAFVCV